MAFLQDYTILDEPGKGGFANVFKVKHNELGYIRAVRVLRDTVVDKKSKKYQNFLRECKLLLRLGNGNHPNIVHIYKPDLLENKAFVEMDFVDGECLSKYLAAEKYNVPAHEVIRMATQIGSALAFCHEDIYRFCLDKDEFPFLRDDPNDGTKVIPPVGEERQQIINIKKVIHNDIHSGNIMRREDGNFMLLDFGLAIDGDECIRCSSMRHSKGAEEYKPPEKQDDESILTEQSDIYSFGIVLYQYLAGRVPFPYDNASSDGQALAEIEDAHKKQAPPPIETLRKEFFEKKHKGQKYQKDYPDWLEEMILKCLEKDPSKRFKNGKELYNFILQHGGDNETLYRKEIEQLNGETKKLQSQLNEKQARLNDKQTELDQTYKNLEDISLQRDRLSVNLTKKKHAIRWLTATLIVIVMGVSVAGWWTYQHKDMPSTETPVISSNDVSTHNEEEVSAELKNLTATIEQQKQQLKEKDDEIATLRKSAPNDAQKNTDEIKRLKGMIADKETQISDLQARMNKVQERANSLTTQLSEQKDKVTKLTKQLDDEKKKSSANSANSASANDNLQKQLLEKKNEVQRLSVNLSNAEKEIADLQNKLNKANKEIKALQDALMK